MGNSSRRPTQSSSSSSDRSTTFRSTLSIATHQKLAPIQLASEGESECPICFVTYMEFNTSKCCKQIICTDCFLQLKNTADPPCPFCGKEMFLVTYVSNPNVSPQTDSKSGSTVDLQTVDSSGQLSGLDANIPPPLPSNPLSYVTPEQDRKLRSTSFDHTGTPVASRADREALEAEIHRQRIQALDYEFILNSDRPVRSTQRSALLPIRYAVSQNRSTTSSNGNGNGHRRSDVQRSTANRACRQPLHRSSGDIGSPIRQPNSRSGGEPTNTQTLPSSPYIDTLFQHDEEYNISHFLHDDDTHLLMALQSFLSAESSSPAMPSLEQLEEMMLMEAIRQSMRETPTSNLLETSPAPNNIGIESHSISPEAIDVSLHHNTDDERLARNVNFLAENLAIESSPAPASPDLESTNRLLDDIERALSTPHHSQHPPP